MSIPDRQASFPHHSIHRIPLPKTRWFKLRDDRVSMPGLSKVVVVRMDTTPGSVALVPGSSNPGIGVNSHGQKTGCASGLPCYVMRVVRNIEQLIGRESERGDTMNRYIPTFIGSAPLSMDIGMAWHGKEEEEGTTFGTPPIEPRDASALV